MYSLGNFSDVWRFIHRTPVLSILYVTLSLSIFFFARRYVEQLHALAYRDKLYASPKGRARARGIMRSSVAAEKTFTISFPLSPQPQRHLPSYITLVHVIAVMHILLLNVLIDSSPFPRLDSRRMEYGRDVGNVKERDERVVVEVDEVRNWALGTTGAVSVSFAFQMPWRENETRRRPSQWLAHYRFHKI